MLTRVPLLVLFFGGRCVWRCVLCTSICNIRTQLHRFSVNKSSSATSHVSSFWGLVHFHRHPMRAAALSARLRFFKSTLSACWCLPAVTATARSVLRAETSTSQLYLSSASTAGPADVQRPIPRRLRRLWGVLSLEGHSSSLHFFCGELFTTAHAARHEALLVRSRLGLAGAAIQPGGWRAC